MRRQEKLRRVFVRGGLTLVAVFVVLALATRNPLRALGLEAVGVVALWFIYAGRFALMTPRALAPEVLWFALQDRWNPPDRGRVLFAGSSTIAHWSSLEEDMAPLRVVNRGINGARLHQIAYYADRIISPYEPSAVVVYAGENDIAGFLGSRRMTPEQVLFAFQTLCMKVHARLPRVPISFISIKPAKRRSEWAPAFRTANDLIRAYSASDVRIRFIDIVTRMIDATGEPRSDVFEPDAIHLNDQGYRILTSVVRPALMDLTGMPVPVRFSTKNGESA
jgi:lysophospholipase L1-like esterase